MARRRKIERMKRRIKRRLTEFLLRAVGGLLDHTIGPDEKMRKSRQKKQRAEASETPDVGRSVASEGPT